MNSRTWRAGALGIGISVIVLLATQRAAGEPNQVDAVRIAAPLSRTIQSAAEPTSPSRLAESTSLLLLGSAFVVVAQQLRRLQ